MVQSSKGTFHRGRKKLKKELREKFKPETYLKKFKIGNKVIIRINQSSHKGIPSPRMIGKVGMVAGKRGDSYLVNVKIGFTVKQIQTYPEHLRLLAE